MKSFLSILIPCMLLLNCISYYKYDKKLLDDINTIGGGRLRVNRLYNTISLTKGRETGLCSDILEDNVIDDSRSEFSVNVLINDRLENRGNPFIALIHLSSALATAGIIPYTQTFTCNYNIKVLKKNKLILSHNDSYSEKSIFTFFFLFLLPFRKEEEGLQALDNFKKNNITLIRKAVLNEK